MTLYTPIKSWWCCLNPSIRNMVILLIPSFFANEEYVLGSQYTVYALVTGLAASITIDAYFKSHYGLTDGFILDEEGLPVAVVFFDLDQWTLFLAFSATDDFICTGQCKLLTFPN